MPVTNTDAPRRRVQRDDAADVAAERAREGDAAHGMIQTQSPIILEDRSEPEPDVCVVRGTPRD
jgi:hypothetical protein